MKVSFVLRESWATYKEQWWHLVPIAFFLYFFLSLFALIATAAFGGTIGVLAGLVLTFVGYFWLQAIHMEETFHLREGHTDVPMRQVFREARPRVKTLVAAALLGGIALVVGFVLLIVPALVLMTRWSMLVPVVVLERAGVREAFRRSSELVRGNGWKVFSVLAITYVFVVPIFLLVQYVLGQALAGTDPELRSFISDLIYEPLTAPLIVLVWTSMYFRLKEAEAYPAAATPVPTSVGSAVGSLAG